MTYVIEGLDPAPFRRLFGLSDEQLAGFGAVRVTADSPVGFPCRITLQEANPGETLLLLNHESRGGNTPYRTSHAIFLRETALAAAQLVDEVPEVFAPRQLSLRGFDDSGMMIDALIVQPGQADEGLRQLFEEPRIVEIDVHNAVRGCFSARARRLS